jgi:predicted nucleic acid-binding protein
MSRILIDSGPIIALLHRNDLHHGVCVEALRKIRASLVTVWPVLTEAMYLLNFSWRAQEALWNWVEAGMIGILPLGQEDASRMKELMKKYRDLPMDLADGALVHVAERERIRTIFTLDHRDFQIYRPIRMGRFSLIPHKVG